MRTETRKSVNMRSSRRQSNKFQQMASEFRRALDMNREIIWVKIFVACVVECLANFKEMRKSLF